MENSEKNNMYNNAGDYLSTGLVNIFEPPLKEARKQLKELVDKQHELIVKLHSENVCLTEIQHSDELQEVFHKIKLYNNKLQTIKKNIRILLERSVKLKKRALKLQQIKEKESVEEIIISKPSSSIIRSTPTS